MGNGTTMQDFRTGAAGPQTLHDPGTLLSTTIRVILLLAAAAGFADRTGIASVLWSFVGHG